MVSTFVSSALPVVKGTAVSIIPSAMAAAICRLFFIKLFTSCSTYKINSFCSGFRFFLCPSLSVCLPHLLMNLLYHIHLLQYSLRMDAFSQKLPETQKKPEIPAFSILSFFNLYCSFLDFHGILPGKPLFFS